MWALQFTLLCLTKRPNRTEKVMSKVMEETKFSFLSKRIGEKDYEDIKKAAFVYFIVGSVIFGIVYTLTYFYNNGLLSFVLDWCSCISPLFILYILSFVLLLDIRLSIEKRNVKIVTFITMLWNVIILLPGLYAMYYTYNYRYAYKEKCTIYYVEKGRGIYHLYDECNDLPRFNVVELNGNQLNKVHFKLCPSCLEIKQEDDGYALEHFVAN